MLATAVVGKTGTDCLLAFPKLGEERGVLSTSMVVSLSKFPSSSDNEAIEVGRERRPDAVGWTWTWVGLAERN
jgi:hypothetical protein